MVHVCWYILNYYLALVCTEHYKLLVVLPSRHILHLYNRCNMSMYREPDCQTLISRPQPSETKFRKFTGKITLWQTKKIPLSPLLSMEIKFLIHAWLYLLWIFIYLIFQSVKNPRMHFCSCVELISVCMRGSRESQGKLPEKFSLLNLQKLLLPKANEISFGENE